MLQNLRHGQGVFSWADGSVYRGGFRGDKRHGQGVLATADGLEFSGGWACDAKHGAGTWKNRGRLVRAAYYWEGREVGRNEFQGLDKQKAEGVDFHESEILVMNHSTETEVVIPQFDKDLNVSEIK